MTLDSPFQDTPAPDAAPQARLGIAHLLIWTAGSALIMAVQRNMGTWEQTPPSQRWFFLAMAIPNCMIYGALVGSTAVGMGRWYRGIEFPVHPGQWIAVLQGAAVVGVWTMAAIWLLQIDDESPDLVIAPPMAIYFVSQGVINLALVAGYLAVVWRKRFETRWKVLLVVLALEVGALAAFNLLAGVAALIDATAFDWFYLGLQAGMFAQMAGRTIVAVVLAVAVFGDLRLRAPRDWMHYVGVIATAWQCASIWIHMLWSWLAALLM